MNLFHAANQWATRPQDERFDSLEAMHRACLAYAAHAAEARRPWRDLKLAVDNGQLVMVGPSGAPATLTHYAMGQLCGRAGAPAGFVRQLPAPLAVAVLSDRLAARPDQGAPANLLFHRNGGLVLRATLTDNYVRVWNHEVIARLLDLADQHNLTPARQTFTWDGSPLPPEAQRPPSLYASDHDMFAFMMSRGRSLEGPHGEALYRGVIVQNSEVGDSALRIMGFWFRELCANHIIWGATQLAEVRLTHVGQIRQRWISASVRVRQYLDAGTGSDAARLRELTVPLQGDRDDVLDMVMGKRIPGLTRKALEAATVAVIPEQDGEPLSQWGLAQGLTRHSQTLPYGDERTDLDRAAGKLLQVAF